MTIHIPKFLVYVFFFFTILLLVLVIYSLPDGLLHISFCNVGQGDAIYIRAPDGTDMLIDGGPNNKVLDCLGEKMPFFDRELDIVLLTHAQADHLTGLVSVLKRYSVKYFVSGPEGNDIDQYQELIKIINEEQINVRNLYRGTIIKLGQLKLDFVWPPREWTFQRLDTAGNNLRKQQAVLGAKTTANLNNFSQVFLLSFGLFDAFFTGDAESDILKLALQEESFGDIEVLKVPHHGAKKGLTEDLVERIDPDVAVVSVGKNNYGHPNSALLDELKRHNVGVLRTDVEGTIEIVTDGKRWWER